MTFDEEIFPIFTVKVVTKEEQEEEITQSKDCHCSEQALVGSVEVQEWRVELDNVDRPSSSSSSDRESVGSPDSMTDHQMMVVSPHIPPSDSVTHYSLESTSVAVSYTFELQFSKY